MGEMLFHNSYPRQWRLILRGLTFFSLILAVLLLALSILSDVRGDDRLPTYVVFIAFIPGYIAHLLRSAISTEGPDADDTAFAFAMLICAVTLAAVIAICFEHGKGVKQQALLEWTVSNVCSDNGEFRPELRDECRGLMAHSQTRLCVFGRTPMGACEAELRQKLNRPVGWKPGHASRN